jgi:hypothetical protein
VAAAARGCDAAYYLVHSLDTAGFEKQDAEAARTSVQWLRAQVFAESMDMLYPDRDTQLVAAISSGP